MSLLYERSGTGRNSLDSQYAHMRTPLYWEIAPVITYLTGVEFWLDLDGDLSAPECIPCGSAHCAGCSQQSFLPRENQSANPIVH